MIPTFTRSYEASADIAGRRLVRFSDTAASQKMAQASANTQAIVGVSDAMGAVSGGMCVVHRAGLVSVELGGTVTAGAPLTADANGKAIAAAASTLVRIAGFADQPGVSGDIIDMWVAPGLLDRA